jgi:hypothetical protein
MNTTENNKLIAEFMGARATVFRDGTKGHTFWNEEGVEGRSGSFPNGATNYFKYDEGYHTSWDWLMPVVRKCREIMNDFGIESIEYNFLENNIFQTDYTLIDFLNGDIDCINERVVRFIKWYNENKED